MYGRNIAPENYGTRKTFADIAATVLQYLDVESDFQAESILH
jgi:phosphopentomutase